MSHQQKLEHFINLSFYNFNKCKCQQGVDLSKKVEPRIQFMLT